MNNAPNRDVVVVGAGVAGLSLGLQLKQTCPQLSVTVLERGPLPIPREVRKLGESTSEVAAWYLRERLGLGQHLEREHVVKYGLRFWQGTGPFASRHEYGAMMRSRFCPGDGIPLRPHAYQLDRGKLEHELAARCEAAGVELRDQTSVAGVHRQANQWEVVAHRHDDKSAPTTITSRWVFDATGKTQLSQAFAGTPRDLDHHLTAMWWWLDRRVDPTEWTQHDSFRQRIAGNLRWRSTQHVLGHGHWTWLIGLANECTSVGLLVDRTIHPQCTDRQAMRELLQQADPELAKRVLDDSVPTHLRVLDSNLHEQIVGEGWGITGQALGFLDPLFSPGLDLMAVTNELLVATVTREVRGEALETRATNLFLSRLFEQYASLYKGMYHLLDDPVIAPLKLMWDQLIYFAWICPVALGGLLQDHNTLRELALVGDRVARTNLCVQQIFRDWRNSQRPGVFAGRRALDHTQLDMVMGQFLRLRDTAPAEQRLSQNFNELSGMAIALVHAACADLGLAQPDSRIDPRKLVLDPEKRKAAGMYHPRRGRAASKMALEDLAYALQTTPAVLVGAEHVAAGQPHIHSGPLAAAHRAVLADIECGRKLGLTQAIDQRIDELATQAHNPHLMLGVGAGLCERGDTYLQDVLGALPQACPDLLAGVGWHRADRGVVPLLYAHQIHGAWSLEGHGCAWALVAASDLWTEQGLLRSSAPNHQRMLCQGIGRGLWLRYAGDINALVDEVAACPPTLSRHLWVGVGMALVTGDADVSTADLDQLRLRGDAGLCLGATLGLLSLPTGCDRALSQHQKLQAAGIVGARLDGLPARETLPYPAWRDRVGELLELSDPDL